MEAIPATVQAVLVFAAFIVPGFLLGSGYARTSRSRGAVEIDLYGLAEAVVGSLFVMALAWWWKGQDVFNWAITGHLRDHEQQEYELLVALLLVPYPLGMALGAAVSYVKNEIETRRPPEGSTSLRAKLFYQLDLRGILTLPSVWDQAWNQLGRHGATLLVRVHMNSGRDTVGMFEHGSWVGTGREPRDVYLRRVYRHNEDTEEWEPVPLNEGVVINASAIESVEFLWSSGCTEQDDEQGHGAGQDSDPGVGTTASGRSNRSA